MHKSCPNFSFRKQLINEISNIYPLEEIFEAKTERRQHSIFGFVVPNADDISTIKSADEEKVASGLGYTAHTLLMISQFLDMPLRFPIIHRGSRLVMRRSTSLNDVTDVKNVDAAVS